MDIKVLIKTGRWGRKQKWLRWNKQHRAPRDQEGQGHAQLYLKGSGLRNPMPQEEYRRKAGWMRGYPHLVLQSLRFLFYQVLTPYLKLTIKPSKSQVKVGRSESEAKE